jgi:oxygen-independent coproporphyrinogen-3 oxidase
MSEFMFTGLRKVEGIRLSDYEKRFALPVTAVYGDPINKHIETGLLEIDEKADRLRLTAKGMDLFNRVLVDFV